MSATRREAEFAKILAWDTVLGQEIACEQALQGALAGGRRGAGKGRGACNYVSGIEYLHRKSRREMLIGGHDISDDIITRGTCLHSRSLQRRADWQKSDSSVDGEQHGYWKWNSNYRDVFESSPSFSRHTAGAPRRAC